MEKNQLESPRVLVCHSSKDMKRFVLKFATRLRENGIDAWLDKWEMQIGDSLVDKIFKEGIKNCEKFIIVLSKNSIGSKWVKEELDTGVVKKIEKQTTIMPIIIDDDIEIPTVLIATVCKKIPNLESYDDEFEEIVNAILGVTDKPPLGGLPKYAIDTVPIGSLSQIDSKILKILIDHLFEMNKWTRSLVGIDFNSLWAENEITREQVTDSLEILDDEYYIEMSLTNAGWYKSPFEITTDAIIEYAENYILDFNKKVLIIISKIINENIMQSDVLAEQASLDKIIVNSVIKEWEELEYIKYVWDMGGDGIRTLTAISAKGKRYLREMINI